MIRTSPQTEQFDEAFAKAQAKFEAAVKSNVNPAFRSKYADVSSVIDATLEHLNSEGIGVQQHPGFEHKTMEGGALEPFMVVTTRLAFKGQWVESELAIPAVQRERFDAQSCGSALTYACRYALQGIFVVRREDDDANAAAGRGSSAAAQDVANQKIKAGRAGKDVNTLESPTNGQEQASEGPAQLVCYPIGDGWYEVTGESETMEQHKGLLLLYGKRKGRERIVQMEAGQLDTFKREFCEVRGGILTALKERHA